jgi:DNA-binding LacI/PurR family transcriptional regulator
MPPKSSILMPFARKDVARLAGVPTPTVRYVINDGLRSVIQEPQRRMVWAIEEHLYLSGAIGRSLVTRKTYFIGFVLPDIPKLIHAAMARALEEALETADYSRSTGNRDE